MPLLAARGLSMGPIAHSRALSQPLLIDHLLEILRLQKTVNRMMRSRSCLRGKNAGWDRNSPYLISPKGSVWIFAFANSNFGESQ